MDISNFSYIHKYGSSSVWDGLIDICVSHPNKFVYITDNVNLKVYQLYFNGLEVKSSCSNYGHNSEHTWGSPAGICYNDGYLYVVDKTNHTLVILDYRDLKYINHFGTVGTSGSTSALLNSPQGVCCDGLYLYITDTGNNRIVKLDLSLNYKSVSDVTLSTPVGIEYDKEEDVFLVVDQGNDKILKINKNLSEQIDTVGSNGTGDGEFDTPQYITVDDENFYVTDSANHRVQVFEKGDMAFLNEDGSEGDDDDQYDTPSGIVYYNAMLFTTDANDRIKVTTNYRTARSRESDEAIGIDDSSDEWILDEGSLVVDSDTYTPDNTFVENEPENHKVAWSEG